MLILNLEKEKKELPYLLKYYRENFKLMDISEDLSKRFNNENNLTEEQIDILKKAIFND